MTAQVAALRTESPPGTIQIGVSRPPLPLGDIPTPEEVFNKKRIGPKELVTCVLGPSMIALGVSIGSGEWLLGPLGFGKYGFIGLGFLVMISAVLQTFYNVENARYTLATGEVPIVGFYRAPPGVAFWLPACLILMYVAWVWGGWASAAGQALYSMFIGKAVDLKVPENLQMVHRRHRTALPVVRDLHVWQEDRANARGHRHLPRDLHLNRVDCLDRRFRAGSNVGGDAHEHRHARHASQGH